jgi:predicted peptidase
MSNVFLWFLLVPLLILSSANGVSAAVVGYHMKTDVLTVGQRVISVSVEYDRPLKGVRLARDTLKVTVDAAGDGVAVEVPIIETFVSASADGDKPSDGKYAVIRFDPWTDPADTRRFDDAAFLTIPRDLNYNVTQKKPLMYADGSFEDVSGAPILKKGQYDNIISGFAAKSFESDGGALNYRLYTPEKRKGEKYPLVLALHGAGEAGDSNTSHITANIVAAAWAMPEVQMKHPSYVLAPQVPKSIYENGRFWAHRANESRTIALIKYLIANEPIDPARVYVSGLSMGGYGTWNMIADNPDIFAAAMPVCGFFGFEKGHFGPNRSDDAGNPKPTLPAPLVYGADELKELLGPAKDLPIRIFHAADDNLVDVENSRRAFEVLKSLGADVAYTEYPAEFSGIVSSGNPHYSWEVAYTDMDNIDWLFLNVKKK